MRIKPTVSTATTGDDPHLFPLLAYKMSLCLLAVDTKRVWQPAGSNLTVSCCLVSTTVVQTGCDYKSRECRADTCCWTCIVVSAADSGLQRLHLKFFLNISQHGEFIAQLQGCQHWVLIGQGEVGWTGETPVGVYPRSGVAEGVKLLLVVTGVAAAKVVVRGIDASPFTQQRVNYLIFLAVRCKDQWSNIVRKPVGKCKQNLKLMHLRNRNFL